MSDGVVRSEFHADHPHVLVVTVDRPPVNAMSVDTYLQIAEIFSGIVRRPDVRCVIFTGAGEKAFIAGADVKALSQKTPEIAAARLHGSRTAYDAIWRCAVPVVAAVNGPALGAGFIMASLCNIIVASEKATFGLPEINVGVLGGSRHISRVLPFKVVERMALTGDRVDAHYLERLGAIQSVVPPGKLLEEAFRIADNLASKSPTMMRMRKESLLLTEALPMTEGYRVEQLFTGLAGSHPDSKEAARAVVERRPPVWKTD